MTDADRIQLLPGTLEMLVLQTLIFGPRHGHGISTTIQRTSGDALLVDHGSLYPANDTLAGEYRQNHGAGVHVSAAGLEVHGKLWAAKVKAWLDGMR